MIPLPINPCWRELASGKRSLQTDQLGLQMLLQRVRLRLTRQNSVDDVNKAALELYSFFLKYEKILAAEVKALS